MQMGQRLSDERTRQNLTLRVLAEKAGISKTTPSAIELGHYSASLAVVEDLSRALDVSPAWLAFGMGPREPPPLHLRTKVLALVEWLEGLDDERGKETAALLRVAYGL